MKVSSHHEEIVSAKLTSTVDTLNTRHSLSHSTHSDVARGKRAAQPISSHHHGAGNPEPYRTSTDTDDAVHTERYLPFGKSVSSSHTGNFEKEEQYQGNLKQHKNPNLERDARVWHLKIAINNKERELLNIESNYNVVSEELRSLREELELLRRDPMGCDVAIESRLST